MDDELSPLQQIAAWQAEKEEAHQRLLRVYGRLCELTQTSQLHMRPSPPEPISGWGIYVRDGLWYCEAAIEGVRARAEHEIAEINEHADETERVIAELQEKSNANGN